MKTRRDPELLEEAKKEAAGNRPDASEDLEALAREVISAKNDDRKVCCSILLSYARSACPINLEVTALGLSKES